MEYYIENKRDILEGRVFPFECFISKNYDESAISSAHLHDAIEILYCLSGEIKVFLDGKQYDFAKGDMILFNSREIHNIFGASDHMNSYIVLKFDPEILYTTPTSIFEARYVLPFTMSQSTHQKVFREFEISNTDIPPLLHETLAEFEEKRYGFELAVRTNICKIFLWILRNWHSQGVELNIGIELTESIVKRLQVVFNFVEENYQRNITVLEVAELCNMSYSYFSRYFKAITKKNFSEYVNFARITHAEKLLTTSDMTITEVAFEVGFSSTSYFIERFKHYKNTTPKQFLLNFNQFDATLL